MIPEESIQHLAALLRTTSDDVERLASLSPGQESSRAVQNVRASLDAIRQLLIPLAADDGGDASPLMAVCFEGRAQSLADFDDT